MLSVVSIVGVCVGTAALVVVLSVFNGLEDITRQMFKSYHSDLEITASQGKVFKLNTATLQRLTAVEGVTQVVEVVEDNALVRYDDKQKIVKVKGVSDNYLSVFRLDTLVPVGNASFMVDSVPRALVGSGVQYELSVRVGNSFKTLQFWYPERDKKTTLNPEKAFNKRNLLPGGVFLIDPQYDKDYILVPIAFARDLMRYTTEVSALEIDISGNRKVVAAAQAQLTDILGNQFNVKTLEEQQSGILRALHMERLFAFITFAFILAIASFNVLFSIAMLVIEKRRDIAVLKAAGASPSFIRKIFLAEGSLIGFIGTGLGLLTGFVLVYLQQQYGFVKLGVNSSVVDAYPVKLQLMDFVFTLITVVSITILASVWPARKAARTQASHYA